MNKKQIPVISGPLFGIVCLAIGTCRCRCGGGCLCCDSGGAGTDSGSGCWCTGRRCGTH